MGSKVYKGQEVVVEGSLSGETIIITKLSYDSAFNLEYLGEAKIGTFEYENKFFIQKFIYDPAFNLVEIQNAINRSSVGANMVSVDVTSSPSYVIVNLPDLGDFTEVRPDDSISLMSPLNEFNVLPVHSISSNTKQLLILKSKIPANVLATIVDEAAVSINEFDLVVQFNSEEAKDYAKRRWDHRTRYIYA